MTTSTYLVIGRVVLLISKACFLASTHAVPIANSRRIGKYV